MMKLCFSTLGCHEFSLDEVLALAKQYGVSAIEVRGLNGEMSNDAIADFQDEQSELTRLKMNEAKVFPLILGTSCKFHDADKVQQNIEKAKKEIDLASRAGFRAIRVFGNLIVEPEHACIAQVASALDEVCRYAASKSVKVYLEVHGDFNTVERLTSLIEQMHEKENFALIWDIYHTHHVYGHQWRLFYEALKEWIEHVHLKDAVGKKLTLPSEGELEIVEIVWKMLEDGYTGWFSLEWERKWEPQLPELETALKKLKEMLDKNQITG